jgi:hypothetical protein
VYREREEEREKERKNREKIKFFYKKNELPQKKKPTQGYGVLVPWYQGSHLRSEGQI